MAWAERVYKQDIPAIDASSDALPEIPDFFRAEPAVKEAQLIVRGSRSRPIPDGRVV